MPTTFDISEGPNPSPQQPQFGSSSGGGRGTGTQLDDIARTIFYIALAASVLFLGYLFWGLFGGAWANPAFGQLVHADKARQLGNIDLIFGMLRISTCVAVLSVLIMCLRDEMIGYILVAVGAVFYLGLPFATSQIYDARGLSASNATRSALTYLQSLWMIFVIPGSGWVAADLVRRFKALSENTAVQRANLKYGSDVARQSSKQRQRFLGRCWETAFCRDHVREKCPIYIKRRGPCWWYKEGCMCEEHIVLQAVISSDWKQKTKAVDNSLSLGAGAAGMPKTILSPAAKRDRCRKCIIYNEHQRDKYKALTAVTVLAVPALLYLNLPLMEGWVGAILKVVDGATSRFALSAGNHGSTLSSTATSGLVSFLIVCLGLVILSQALKLVEYCCFKLKI
ncbi:hypothetical protein CCAX7_27340 [Capsulimonas corticalis]|uniref:Uncharacterized protein n=1 Tax=Capsulimonas corticalis TaxID=2219043 RepID=A0A402CTN0_9BACT|nr:hypothetical protein [Capsulimonas corticalis]BDI30683.1 hypothetical protein CCAX7_27340 [Capsulimonas corticalis]